MLFDENKVRKSISILKNKRKCGREDRVVIMQIVPYTYSQVERAMNRGHLSDFLVMRIKDLLQIIDVADIATKVSALSNPIMVLMNAIMWMAGLSPSCDPDGAKDSETNESILPLGTYERWLIIHGMSASLMELKWQNLQRLYELERERRHLRYAM